jgi:hypothetical protein
MKPHNNKKASERYARWLLRRHGHGHELRPTEWTIVRNAVAEMLDNDEGEEQS